MHLFMGVHACACVHMLLHTLVQKPTHTHIHSCQAPPGDHLALKQEVPPFTLFFLFFLHILYYCFAISTVRTSSLASVANKLHISLLPHDIHKIIGLWATYQSDHLIRESHQQPLVIWSPNAIFFHILWLNIAHLAWNGPLLLPLF